MIKAFVFLATGFEEIEAIAPIDVLRRAEIETVTVSISDNKTGSCRPGFRRNNFWRE